MNPITGKGFCVLNSEKEIYIYIYIYKQYI
uniref:Uncharacterized protein n=1 Tax=Heterorhabditis bacteriophora TaxID=37862 RepID=A0A1I7XAX7_HETBA